MLFQKLLSYYNPWFAGKKRKRESRSERERESESERERESESERESEDGLGTRIPMIRRRHSAPGVADLTCLRPPRVAGPSTQASGLSVYHDAVVRIETDSDSDS